MKTGKSPAAMRSPQPSVPVSGVFVLAILSFVVLVGCTEVASDETGQPDSDRVSTDSTAGSSGVEPAPESVFTIAPSPGNPNGFANLYDLLVAEQEFIQDCMRAQGFEYIPKSIDLALADSSLAGDADVQLTDYDSALSQAQDYGYGELYMLLLNTDESRPAPTVDPNDEKLDSLSQEEKEARAIAIYGTENGGGCINEAVEFSRGQEILSPDEIELRLEVEARIAEAIAADARIVQAEQGWLACMADEGYEVSSLDEVGDSVLLEAEEILGIGLSSETSEDQLRTALSDEALRDELIELHDRERELATADIECRKDLIELRNSLYQRYSEEIWAEE